MKGVPADFDEQTVHTDPETRGKCGFCGKEENGYAIRDGQGKFKAACWKCCKKARDAK